LARATDFNLAALHAALDEQRQARGLSWPQVVREIDSRFRDVPVRSISRSTVTNLRTRSTAEGDGVLQMLRWLNRTPESFLPGHQAAESTFELPGILPHQTLRFDTRKLHAALDTQRIERGLTWRQVANEVEGISVSSLTRLRMGGRTSFPQVMRMVGWLFFMLRDGDAMSRYVRDRLPFSAQENERLMIETRDLVIASVGAGLIVAAAQGIIGGVTFWLVGIRAPVFWGVLTGFCSFIPVVGAALVWVPAAIGLLLSGEIGRGVLMALIGAFGISMVDNVLRPLLLSGRTSVSGLVIFFGLLGGAAAFGFIGVVIGPIILVTTARLLENLRRPDDPPENPITAPAASPGHD
jgi:predicted PurR-regulated permease PerM